MGGEGKVPLALLTLRLFLADILLQDLLAFRRYSCSSSGNRDAISHLV